MQVCSQDLAGRAEQAGRLANRKAVMQAGQNRQEGKEDRAGRNARKAEQAVRQA
jgi:hypothetical protein